MNCKTGTATCLHDYGRHSSPAQWHRGEQGLGHGERQREQMPARGESGGKDGDGLPGSSFLALFLTPGEVGSPPVLSSHESFLGRHR